jgi:hypothetical protein
LPGHSIRFSIGSSILFRTSHIPHDCWKAAGPPRRVFQMSRWCNSDCLNLCPNRPYTPRAIIFRPMPQNGHRHFVANWQLPEVQKMTMARALRSPVPTVATRGFEFQ